MTIRRVPPTAPRPVNGPPGTILLDTFSAAGGCSVGFARAGFYVIGSDIEEHEDYPFPVWTGPGDTDEYAGDSLDLLKRLEAGERCTFTARHSGETIRVGIEDITVVGGSPPCPRWATSTPEQERMNHPDFLTPMHEWVVRWAATSGRPWVIENVMRAPVPNAVMLCGRAMGYRWTARHRKFGSSVPLMAPGCACGAEAPYGVTGESPERRDYARHGRKARGVEHAREVMGIDWMGNWHDLKDAIPPGYAEFVGGQIMQYVQEHGLAAEGPAPSP